MKHFSTLSFIFLLIFGLQSPGQTKKSSKKEAKSTAQEPASAPAASTEPKAQETIKFKVEGDLATKEVRDPINFKMDDKFQPKLNSEQLPPDENVFVAYPGYPKHQIAVSLVPTQVNSKWTYGSQDYNYETNSTAAYGFTYNYISTPLTTISFDYSQYNVAVDAATPSSFTIAESNVTVANYGIKSQFCSTRGNSFYQKFCYGADLGVESYPLLDFNNANNANELSLTKIDDIIIGLNIGYNHPLFAGVVLKTKAGYNYGMGTGSKGELSIKANSAFYVLGDLEYAWKDHHGFVLGAEYKLRNAKVEGLRGSNEDSWESVIATTALKASYLYTF